MYSHPTSKITTTGKRRCFVRTYKNVTRRAKCKQRLSELDDYCHAQNDLVMSLRLESEIYRKGQNKYKQEYLRMHGYYINLVERKWKKENPSIKMTGVEKKRLNLTASELADNDAFQAAVTAMRESASVKPVQFDFYDTETIVDYLATRLMNEFDIRSCF